MRNVSYSEYSIDCPIKPRWLYIIYVSFIAIAAGSLVGVVNLLVFKDSSFDIYEIVKSSMIIIIVIVFFMLYDVQYVRVYNDGRLFIRGVFGKSLMLKDVVQLDENENYHGMCSVKLTYTRRNSRRYVRIYIKEDEKELFLTKIYSLAPHLKRL